ncbi:MULTISPECIES: heparin lyase I family protein [Variovorax]|jgi:hypothetical protein|uniref:heparin lyase I family protein n=1 Tax=Variovorax TaxID=34072 RepID=UPI000B21693D|nr:MULTISPECIES: heparin lyase I family protein [Variovorax]UKI10794.1 polysaccharide lyase [Variovorax paradoxus]
MNAERLAWPLGWVHQLENGYFVDETRQVQIDKNVQRFPGNPSQRFELQNGDIGSEDKKRTVQSERCEMSEQGERQTRGDECWYGWSFMVPRDFPEANQVPDSSNQVTLAQFHQEPLDRTKKENWHPAWMFGKRIGGPFCVRLFPTIHLAKATWWSLIEHDGFTGKWHDIMVYAKWCSEGDGAFLVWVNGVQKMAYFGKTCSEHDGLIYHKYGIYRAHHSLNRTAIAYYSQLRKSKNQAEVRVSAS